MSFLIRLAVNAVALWFATQFVPGVHYEGDPLPFLVVSLIFGLINATIRPLLKLLTCPLILLTLGLFALVVNGLMLMLTSWIAEGLGIGLRVDGFWPAFLGALVISLVSALLSMTVRVEKNSERS